MMTFNQSVTSRAVAPFKRSPADASCCAVKVEADLNRRMRLSDGPSSAPLPRLSSNLPEEITSESEN